MSVIRTNDMLRTTLMIDTTNVHSWKLFNT